MNHKAAHIFPARQFLCILHFAPERNELLGWRVDARKLLLQLKVVEETVVVVIAVVVVVAAVIVVAAAVAV